VTFNPFEILNLGQKERNSASSINELMSPFEAFLASIRQKTTISTTAATTTTTTTKSTTTISTTTTTTEAMTTIKSTTTMSTTTTTTASSTTTTLRPITSSGSKMNFRTTLRSIYKPTFSPTTTFKDLSDMEAEETTNDLSINELSSSFYPLLSSEKFSGPANLLQKQSFLTAEEKGFQLMQTTTDNDDSSNEETTERERKFSNVQETTVRQGSQEEVLIGKLINF
jgi:hypothetical protein